ncbi:MAG: helix-hairpin-helix domain-containing protein [Saprospiraceae bacterium]|nr:helix-hairpin-helix domain-containing protein [Saprospiraceae bacterium]
MRIWAIILLTFHVSFLPGQDPLEADQLQQSLIEGLFEDYSQDDGGEILPEWIVALEDLLSRKLDINSANRQDLAVFFFLSSQQIDAIIRHREKFGSFIDPLELQGVPEIDILTMKRVYPFIQTDRSQEDLLMKAHLWSTGQREFTLRYERFLEDKQGFQQGKDGEQSRYEGDASRWVGRLRYVSGNKISYGITFEKDAGEAFLKGSNPYGFDFYSAHLYVRKPWRGCQQLVLGDFGLNFGQGLLISTGFNSGKTAAVTTIKRNPRILFPQNSWQESRFFRGAAAEWSLSRRLHLMTFASYRNRDANTVLSDTSFTELALQVTSFQQSGLHRTQGEITDEGMLREIALGAGLSYQQKGLRLGLQTAFFHYEPVFSPEQKPYNAHFFTGNQLSALSVDFQKDFRGNQWFGEAAYSHNGGWAATSGLLSSPDRRVQMAMLFRHFERDYWNIWGAPIAESALPRNETGIYAGVVLRPVYGWRLSGFVDLWHHPWLTFQSDSPVRGKEQLVRLDYEERRKWQAYLQYRWKGRTIDATGSTEVPNQVETFRQQIRAQFQVELTKIMSLRTRLEWSSAVNNNDEEQGFLIAQDILYKPVGSRWSSTMRYALFKTDGYASRIYMFENDLLYTFGLRPYYYSGQRFYVNVRYRPWNALTLEARYELYRLFDQETIGSGNELIDNNQRSGIKCQVRWMF